ncbi:unnamed protein product [Caenorhabditis brenneri]
MPRFTALKPVSDADLVPNCSQLNRKRKHATDSTSPPTSSSMDRKENIDDYLTKKRTMPQQYCPKSRPPTKEVPAPVTTQAKRPVPKAEDDAKLKIFLDSRPHFRVERKLEAEESEDMKAAKATGGFKDEPKPKKRRAAVPKPFWMKN